MEKERFETDDTIRTGPVESRSLPEPVGPWSTVDSDSEILRDRDGAACAA